MKSLLLAVAIALFPLAGGLVQAADLKAMDKKDDKMAMDLKTAKSTGTVKAVNSKKMTVTIAHKAVPEVNWPAMTMAFKAKQPDQIEGIAPGQRVEFEFQTNGKEASLSSIKRVP